MERPIDCYIAGPISKGSSFANVHRACHVWELLRQNGVFATCPHWSSVQDTVCPIDYEAYMAYDFKLLPLHKCIYRMPGDSAGADREVAEAVRLGIPVFYHIVDVLTYLGVK